MLGSSIAVWAFKVADVGHVDLEIPHSGGIHLGFVFGYVNHSRCFDYTILETFIDFRYSV